MTIAFTVVPHTTGTTWCHGTPMAPLVPTSTTEVPWYQLFLMSPAPYPPPLGGGTVGMAPNGTTSDWYHSATVPTARCNGVARSVSDVHATCEEFAAPHAAHRHRYRRHHHEHDACTTSAMHNAQGIAHTKPNTQTAPARALA